MSAKDQQAPAEMAEQRRLRWYQLLSAIAFIIVCFEIGVFLIVFPWLRAWDANYFSGVAPVWRQLWASPFFRGAVSGLGMINIYISLVEALRLWRGAFGER